MLGHVLMRIIWVLPPVGLPISAQPHPFVRPSVLVRQKDQKRATSGKSNQETCHIVPTSAEQILAGRLVGEADQFVQTVQSGRRRQKGEKRRDGLPRFEIPQKYIHFTS